MIDAITTWLRDWNKNHSERVKMQQAYFVSTLVLAVVAGLIGLVNINFGRNILSIAAVTAAVWLINSVVWALLQSFVLMRLGKPARSAKKK